MGTLLALAALVVYLAIFRSVWNTYTPAQQGRFIGIAVQVAMGFMLLMSAVLWK